MYTWEGGNLDPPQPSVAAASSSWNPPPDPPRAGPRGKGVFLWARYPCTALQLAVPLCPTGAPRLYETARGNASRRAPLGPCTWE